MGGSPSRITVNVLKQHTNSLQPLWRQGESFLLHRSVEPVRCVMVLVFGSPPAGGRRVDSDFVRNDVRTTVGSGEQGICLVIVGELLIFAHEIQRPAEAIRDIGQQRKGG